MNEPKVGSLYKHLRSGAEYRIIAVAIVENSTVGEREVIYQRSAKGDYPIWSRPLNEFNDRFVEVVTPSFDPDTTNPYNVLREVLRACRSGSPDFSVRPYIEDTVRNFLDGTVQPEQDRVPNDTLPACPSCGTYGKCFAHNWPASEFDYSTMPHPVRYRVNVGVGQGMTPDPKGEWVRYAAPAAAPAAPAYCTHAWQYGHKRVGCVIGCGLPRAPAPDADDECERLFWSFAALSDPTQTETPLSARDAFKRTVRPLLLAATYAVNKELRDLIEQQARALAEAREDIAEQARIIAGSVAKTRLIEAESALAARDAVIAAADAMRNMGVNLAQTIVDPGCDGPADPVGDFIEIFDGPLQCAYDAARAQIGVGK